ncbi:uncharacterized protein LOC131322168 isoform X1 [Rhododendron vialii]|uniref:uncharacterized protein LOC131322168 isoform X1 n=1 Tax=Rhododendron vialii TaxID=182163 RepID=UPI00265FA2D7|nr:uncharacterized protein LOC131322168 isoform X1 [Rhododendron vialii]XP_058209387.1 uncharacterized protein LOC131322168 isoform X1 [Rhododendron vialii]
MKQRLQWQLNFVSFKSPEDISGSLRKLDQLIEKGTGPQSFQLAHGQYFKPVLQNKQKQYMPIVCFCFFNPEASWTRLNNLLVSARMFSDSVIFSCQAGLQNAVQAIQSIFSVILQESRKYQGIEP